MRITVRLLVVAVVLSRGPGNAAAPTANAAPASVAKKAPVSPVVDTYEKIRLLVDVLDRVQQNYVDEPDVQQLIYGAAAGMVAALDPFSYFLEPELQRELQSQRKGKHAGLGLHLTIKDRWLTVVTPLPGSPAYRLGILPNDRIVDIEDESTRDITMTQALKKLRGRPGTKVRITIMREPSGNGGTPAKGGLWTSHHYAPVRRKIKLKSVQKDMLERGVGYIRITDFNARTADKFASAMKSLGKDGMTSLILDLRNNPGGLLSAAIDVAAFFLENGKLVVSTRGRALKTPQEYRTLAEARYPDLPLVILVNEGSASGSEMIAGAFQDHRRALVLGMRTYGKASVQSIIPLADGSGLRLTVAHYYTPAGRLIHRSGDGKEGGIVPDIIVAISRETESKLYSQWDMIHSKGRKRKSAGHGKDLVPDEMLDRALELLHVRESLRALSGGEDD